MDNHVDTLIQHTKSESPDQRRQSVIELGKLGCATSHPAIISTLCLLLGDPNIAVREAAEEALVSINSPDVVQSLISCLKSDSTTILNYALEILSKIGKTGIGYILPLLGSRDHDIRKFACNILGNLHYEESVYDLIELLNDPHINVAIAAGEALGKLGLPESVPPLIWALHHSDTWMRCIAAEALGRIGDPRAVEPFLAMSQYEDPIVLYTVIKAMGNLRDERALPYILSLLRTNPVFASSAAQAIENLASLQGDCIYEEVKKADIGGYFLRLLSNDNEDVVRSAITIVGKLQLETAIQPLHQLVMSSQQDMTTLAVAALAQIGQAGIDELHHLLASLLSPDSPDASQMKPLSRVFSVKTAILQALGMYGAPASIPLLCRAFNEETDDDIRIDAAAALGKIVKSVQPTSADSMLSDMSDDAQRDALAAFSCLLQRMSDPSPTVRASLAEILGDIGNKNALSVLVSLLRDANADVRDAASVALGKLEHLMPEEKTRPIRLLLEKHASESLSEDVQASLLRTLYYLTRELDTTFIEPYLHHASPVIRATALETLRTFPINASHHHLLSSLLQLLRDPDFRVRIVAMQTLVVWNFFTEIGMQNDQFPSSVPEYLLTLLADPHPQVRYEACQQLMHSASFLQKNPAFADTIIDALLLKVQDDELLVKIAAIEALTMLKSFSAAKAMPVFRRLLAETHDVEFKNTLQQALSFL